MPLSGYQCPVCGDKTIIVSTAIRFLKSATGSSFADIKKYLQSKYPKTDLADSKNLKLYLKDAVKRREILNVGGKYKYNPPENRKPKIQSKKESKPKKHADPKDVKNPEDIKAKLPEKEMQTSDGSGLE